ncbi:class I SAM-dependent methyltransferase [Parvularcula oceani]|uniref:class I SAM-dependent methyltransferase n=1 Tax=Parvularcula oceani TaxID=1247963 RepID=UPI00068E7F46|nr:methyltransferase domain-containing protein [Parvularcula oceani]
MRTAVSDMIGFYDGALGRLAADHISAKLFEAWGPAKNLRVAGFGYTTPFLPVFREAERLAALVPEGTGVALDEGVPSCLVADHLWPLPNASIDRLLIVHGLEEVAGPRRVLREAWRVLADDGLMIVVCANRRGPWALAETTPFGAGRPYSRRQLDNLLQGAMFAPTAYASALHFPPIQNEALLKVAGAWERLGNMIESWNLPWLFPNLAGVNLIEVRKSMAVPIGGSKAEVFRPVFAPGALRPARRQRFERSRNTAS